MAHRLLALFALAAIGGTFLALGYAQAPEAANEPLPDRFPFDVVESFDAKYDGDRPGHLGRHGGLGDRVPHVALGDPVYRTDGEQDRIIGKVTNLRWSRAQGSLDVEFDPADDSRIAIGDRVWLKLDGK